MKKKLFIAVSLSLVILVLAGCNGQTSQPNQEEQTAKSQLLTEKVSEVKSEMGSEVGYVDVSVVEAKKMIDENPNLIVIDVSPKYDEGHLPGAINYYVGDGSLDEAIPSLDMDATYLIYCHPVRLWRGASDRGGVAVFPLGTIAACAAA